MAGLKYWVWLNECRGLTNRSRALLLDHFGSPEDVYYADEAEYALVEGLSKKQFELLADKSTDGADKILGDCQRLGLRILTMQDADYPARLRGIFEPPCLLYVKGTLPALDLTGDHGLTDDQMKLLRELAQGEKQVDDLIELTQIPARRVLSALTMLELDGYVAQSGGKRFSIQVELKE